MATTVTFKTLAEDIINELEAGKSTRVLIDRVVDADPAIASLAISSEAYASASVNAYDGVNVYFVPLAGDTGNLIYATRITRAGFTAASGTFAFAPSIGGTGWDATNARNIWFMRGYTRTDMLQAVNRVLASMFNDAYLPLTLITDGDMEASGVTGWADAVGTPTQTKETSIVLTGMQSLKIVTTVVDHAVTSASLPVTENETLVLWAPVKCTAGSLRVSLWNVTAGSEIHGVTINEEAWTTPLFTYPVPDNCQNVAVRLVAKTAATTAYVDHVGLLSNMRSIYDLPSSIVDLSYLEDVQYLPRPYPSEASESYQGFTECLKPWPWTAELRDWRAVTSHRIGIGAPSLNPIFLRFKRALPALSADTDTTVGPELVIVEGALSELKKSLGQKRQDGFLLQQAAAHARAYHRMLDNLGLARPTGKMREQYRVSV